MIDTEASIDSLRLNGRRCGLHGNRNYSGASSHQLIQEKTSYFPPGSSAATCHISQSCLAKWYRTPNTPVSYALQPGPAEDGV